MVIESINVCRSKTMMKHLKRSAVFFTALALTGCVTEMAPTTALNDPYIADHVVFSGQNDLVNHVAFGKITRSIGPGGIMTVTIPVRATTPDDLYVDYRLTYFDENHNPIDIPTGWQTQTLHSDIFENIQANSASPRARDFQIEFRPKQ
jgi:hypothetical protein